MPSDGSSSQLKFWPEREQAKSKPKVILSGLMGWEPDAVILTELPKPKLIKASQNYYIRCPECGDASNLRQIHHLYHGDILCCHWCGWLDVRAEKKKPNPVKKAPHIKAVCQE